MQLSITGRNLDLTDSLKAHVGLKFEKLKRHVGEVADVHVILSVEKINQKAEATVQISGTTLFAEDVQPDMYDSIDNVVDKLDKQLIKHKEKLTNHRST